MKFKTPEKQKDLKNGHNWSDNDDSFPSELLESESVLNQLAEVFFTLSLFNSPHKLNKHSGKNQYPDVSETYKILVEQIPAVVFIAFFDRDFREAYVSPQIERTLGFTQEEWLNDPVRWYQQIHPEDKERWSSEAAHVFLTGEPLHSTYRIFAKDGRVMWFQCEVKMVRRDDGQPWFLHGVGFDISKLKRAEEELSFKEEMLSGIFENAPDSMIVVNSTGKIDRVNAQVEAIFGYKPNELIGKPIELLIPERFHERHKTHRNSYIGDPHLRPMGEDFSLQGRRKDDSEFPVEIMLSPVKTETGDFVIAVVRDVTERKKNEEALQKSESQLRSITKSAVDAIIATDVEGKIISWNNGAESIFGYQEKEILEKSLLSLIPKKFRRATEHWLNRYAAKGESLFLGQTVESHGLRKNGEEFPLELSMNTWKTSEGRFYSGIIRDITEQKQVNLELEKARDAALESARLKAEFLANMSHEIRTPMNGVIGMTGLLLDTPLDEVQRDFAETIESSADSLLRIIDDVLDFSKIEAGRLHFENIDFNLGEIIEDRIELQAESAFAKNIELISFIHRDVPQYLCGDPIRIGQVLTNFIGNAIKFTEEGEVTLNVTTESETDDKVLIRFEVKDSGIGISSEAQSKLFQAFTQADGSMTRKYGGTGLGLAISKQLVELMNGEIGVYITPEEGSTFWFTGQFEKQLASIAISPPPYIADLLGAKVLIVDDNQTVRRVLLHQTASWGMIGTEAESADDALYLLRKAAKEKPFNVAILDLTLPQTDGVDLARQIKSDSEIADTNLILLLPGKNTDIKDYRDLDFFTAELHKPIRQAQFNDCLVKVSVQSVEKTTPTVKQKTSFNDNFEAKISSSNIRILVAEDNFISQKVIISQLHRLGYTRINVVSNGLELLEEFKKSEYDIILMDVQMPEMDGFEATSAIRRFERDTKYTPIIAITAHIFEGERDKCLKAGMDDYLGKPFKIKILSHLIEKWTKKEFSMQ